MWRTPVTDRTYEDVLFAAAHGYFIEDLKGARNLSDFVRIGENIDHICELMKPLGYKIPELTAKRNWDERIFINEGEIERLLDDVRKIRAAWAVYKTTPAVPAAPLNYFDKMNKIEKIILDLENAANYILESAKFSGQIFSGCNCADTTIYAWWIPSWRRIKAARWNELSGKFSDLTSREPNPQGYVL